MTVDYEVIEKYVNTFAERYLPEGKRINVKTSDEILLMNCNSLDEIQIGDNAITLILLYSCLASDCKTFREVVFFYYWMNRNWQLNRLEGAFFCWLKLIKILDKNHQKIYGYAQQFYNDVLLLYIVGHEATHICFAQNPTFRDKSKSDVLSIHNTLIEAGKESYGNRVKRQYQNASKSISIEAVEEEFACDRESIKYIYSKLKDSNIDSTTLKKVMLQICDMTVMFQYDVYMEELQSFSLKKAWFRQYRNNHLGKGVLRLANAQLLIMDLLPDEDLRNYFIMSIKRQQKLLSSLGAINIFDVQYATQYIEIDFDESHHRQLKAKIDELSSYINSLLLGEKV